MFISRRNRSVSPCLLLLAPLLLFFYTRFIYAQAPTANLPVTWSLNRLDNHTYKFGNESILTAILYRGAGMVHFACGFYCEDNCEGPSYSFSILIIPVDMNPIREVNNHYKPKIIWSANIDNLVSVNAVLQLTDKGGLVLRDSDKDTTVWSAGTSGEPVAGINLTDTGNLVLFNKNDSKVWQSFDHPTDTLLSGQKLMVGMKLVSRISKKNWTEQSRFSITLTTHDLSATVGRKLDLSYYFLQSELSDDGFVTMGVGNLALFPNSSALGKQVKVINTNLEAISSRYICLDIDGHLRAYGYDHSGWPLMMGDMLPLETCRYPTVCGTYGICSNGQCTCPPSRDGVIYFNPLSLQHPELGCSPNVPLTCEDSQKHTFLEVKGVAYFSSKVDIADGDVNRCKEACMKNCSCKAAFFRQVKGNSFGVCFLTFEMFSMMNMDNENPQLHDYVVFLKVQIRQGDASSADKIPNTKVKKTLLKKAKGANLGVITAFVFVNSATLLLIWSKTRTSDETEEDHVEEVPGMPARFTYADLKLITDDFSKKLGEGGSSAVFKGFLRDGTEVAVKRLDGSRHMKKSFLNEIGAIGSIHHINLVKLLGFCIDKCHWMLVYEYMSNGSLEKWIFESSMRSVLDWQKRRDIILDVAKGLHYLHEQCQQKIVHLDIKPQNILLDDNFRGKVADFGLSKLFDRKDDQVLTTAVRGTPGYLAPEWLNGMITERVDVYSFGMVILEIILGKKVVDTRQGSEDRDLLKLLERKAVEGRLVDLIDAYNNDLKLDESAVADALTVMMIACWCLQTDFRNRPSMSTVIKVLDGVMEVKDELIYDFAHPTFTRSEARSTILSPLMLSGPR